jgi:hypothetical protein
VLRDGAVSRRTSTYWSALLSAEEGVALSRSLRRVCDQLKHHADFLSGIRRTGGRVELFVGWFSGFNSGDVFDHQLLRDLGRLGIDLALDVYGEVAPPGPDCPLTSP